MSEWVLYISITQKKTPSTIKIDGLCGVRCYVQTTLRFSLDFVFSLQEVSSYYKASQKRYNTFS